MATIKKNNYALSTADYVAFNETGIRFWMMSSKALGRSRLWYKTEGKFVPVLNYALRHENLRKSGSLAQRILIWALDGCKWSASSPGHFIPREIIPGTHWVGGC
jgi:hypothetical protein